MLWLLVLSASLGAVFAEPPEREGIAIGYMTTPNSVVYRSTWSESAAMDFWLDIPEASFGSEGGFSVGAGAGYATFPRRFENVSFMLRPQVSFRYTEARAKRGKLCVGIAAAVVAHLENLGIPQTDLIAGISLGSYVVMGEDYTAFHLLLAKDEPFGILLGIMRYF